MQVSHTHPLTVSQLKHANGSYNGVSKSMKGAAFFLGAVIFLTTPLFSLASVSISEILYDLPGTDSKHEWIEVKNDGAPVDLTEWKLFEGESNHKIVAFSGGDVVPEGGYAVLADNPATFLADYPGFSGIVFDVALSGGLNNTNGETLILRDKELNDQDTVTYSPSLGAAGDGNSLHKVGSSWDALLPTPGASPGSARATPPPKEEKPEPVVTVIAKTPPPTPPPPQEPIHAPPPAVQEPASEPKTEIAQNIVVQAAQTSAPERETGVSEEKIPKTEAEPETQNLAAAAALSEPASNDSILIWFIGLGAIILLGLGGMFLVRKKNPPSA